MDVRILELKRRAREMAAARPQPAFNLDCADELAHASFMFFDNSLMLRLEDEALSFLNEPARLGVDHSKRVAIEAAAIVLAEPWDLAQEERRRLALLAEIAGLLHDSMRYEEDHANRGAALALRVLPGYPLSEEERAWIARAVAQHEMASPPPDGAPLSAQLLAGAVHDADLFRFGPDIFPTTLWELCEFDEWPLEKIAAKFPEGPSLAVRRRNNFRTAQGAHYGPALLDEGLALARGCQNLLAQALAATAPKA